MKGVFSSLALTICILIVPNISFGSDAILLDVISDIGYSGHSIAVKKSLQLIDKYPETLNEKDEKGNTALCIVAKSLSRGGDSDKLDVIKSLINNGADVNIKCNGAPAIELAMFYMNGHLYGDEAYYRAKAVAFILEKGANDYSLFNPSVKIGQFGEEYGCLDYELVKTLGDHGVDLSARNSKGKTLLMLVLESPHSYCARGEAYSESTFQDFFETANYLLFNRHSTGAEKDNDGNNVIDLLKKQKCDKRESKYRGKIKTYFKSVSCFPKVMSKLEKHTRKD